MATLTGTRRRSGAEAPAPGAPQKSPMASQVPQDPRRACLQEPDEPQPPAHRWQASTSTSNGRRIRSAQCRPAGPDDVVVRPDLVAEDVAPLLEALV